ncbi:MAG: hypothetical protein KAW45_01415 [Thermoplasmatales archaeon]|nr:hypothetical protein [Thermoplasmatales archaeon]
MDVFRKIGSWLFLIGILIAVIVGLITGAKFWTDTSGYVTLLLAILGFVVGALTFFAVGNITPEKVPTFLLGALLLVGIGTAGSTNWFAEVNIIGPYFTSIAGMLAIFVAPAAGILAIRAIWDAGKTKEIERVIPKLPK